MLWVYVTFSLFLEIWLTESILIFREPEEFASYWLLTHHKFFSGENKKTNWVVPEITESLKSEFSEKFSVNNFALSDADDNSQGC